MAKDSGSNTTATKSPLKPTKKTRKKKVVIEDANLGKKPSKLIQLKASTEAFLEYLQLLIRAGKETNGMIFKATAYVNFISYIKTKSGQDISLRQYINKYNTLKATQREQEAYINAYSGWGCYKVTNVPQTDKEGVIDIYFFKHSQRRPFRKWKSAYFSQLNELLTGKMASGYIAASTDDALDEALE